jgi:hypothetical protein
LVSTPRELLQDPDFPIEQGVSTAMLRPNIRLLPPPATRAVRSLQNGKGEARQRQGPRDNHAADHFGLQHP